MFKISRTLCSCLLNKQQQLYQVSKLPKALLKTTTCANVKEIKAEATVSEKEWTLLYALPTVNFIVAINKLKTTFPKIAFGAGIPLSFLLYQFEQVELEALPGALALVVLQTIILGVVAWPSSGIVGVIRMKNDDSKIQVNYLNYWGKAERVVLDPEEVKVLEVNSMGRKYWSKFLLGDHKTPVKILRTNAYVKDKNVFGSIFGSDLLERRE